MKIDTNIIKTTPKTLPFAFCVYGNPSEEVMEWLKYWKIVMPLVKPAPPKLPGKATQ
jgi:hypothetical protein